MTLRETPAPLILLLGPHRRALSGVSTHLNLLFGTGLRRSYRLRHFQVGSEGRDEGAIARMARLVLSPFALAATVLFRRAAIVHINTSLNRRAYWRDLAYLVAARAAGARVLYQVHGGALPEDFIGRSRLAASFLRATLRLPDAIVVLAQNELKAYRAFVPRQSVSVVPNAIDWADYAALTRVRRDPTAPLRLLYIGRIARDKGLFEAIEGVRIARNRGVAAHFVIAGNGPDAGALQRAAEKAGIAGAVEFAGPAYGGAKIELLRAADVLLLPTYAEGLPYALLECMAAGVPPITTKVGAIPDVVTEGVHGLFVPPRESLPIADAIAMLAANPKGLERMRAACREQIAAHYCSDRLADDFARLYRQVGRSAPHGKPERPEDIGVARADRVR